MSNEFPSGRAASSVGLATGTDSRSAMDAKSPTIPYRLRDLDDFLDSLVLGAADPDGDALPCNYVAAPDWECGGRCFHSREEARQYFISECVLGSGIDRLIWRGMTPADVLALAATLYESIQRLGSPIQEAAIRSSLFGRCDQFNYLAAHG